MSHDYIEESTPQAVDSFNFLSALDSIFFFFFQKRRIFCFPLAKENYPNRTGELSCFPPDED